jgi:hypothetical protein
MMVDVETVSRAVSDEAVEIVTRRQLLEARVQHRGAQLRDFSRHRDRLTSRQLDMLATYHRLEEQYQSDQARLREMQTPSARPSSDSESIQHLRHGADLLREPLMAPRWDEAAASIMFGYSGSVQMSRAQAGISVRPNNPHMAGELTTIQRRPQGGILFNGDIEDTRESIPVDEFDPSATYVWLRNWKYLILFPSPSYRSRFTYQFDVSVFASLFNESDPGTFMSFVSIGETANFTPGMSITVDTDAGWPLVADLTRPSTGPGTGLYNGRYGYLTGRTTVQRSFTVARSGTPAIAIVVGAVGIISMLGRTTYFFGGTGYSSITPMDNAGSEGRITFHYFPLPVNVPV